VARNAFWLALIVGALAAIAAGYAQATLQTRPPPIAQVRAEPAARAARNAFRIASRVRDPGRNANDAFSHDDVVVDRARPSAARWQSERLALFLGLCGYSLAVEDRFLRLRVPVAFVVDPGASQARAVSALAHAAGNGVFVQVGAPPSAAALAAMHGELGAFDGLASESAAGMPKALRGTGLSFFDERGDAAPGAFSAAGVRLIRRDVTADDRSERGYVTFMLERAAELSSRSGPVVVLLRPLPSTLAALKTFASTHDVRMIAMH
jgi:polysaccharide deacetylase 2 family uncharacterized protein YibQ